MEQMDVLDKKKVVAIKGQQQEENIAQLHLERVVELDFHLYEEKEKNDDFNR